VYKNEGNRQEAGFSKPIEGGLEELGLKHEMGGWLGVKEM